MSKQINLWLKMAVLAMVTLLYRPAFSQAKPDTAKGVKPVFTASMGMFNGTSKALGADVKRLVAANPVIKVKDAKGGEYKVVAFEVTWKRKELSDDVKTGKPKTVFYMVGTDVRGNQLPDILKQQIGSSLQAGEEVMLSNILYLDATKKINAKASNNITISIL
jgi:hypothetical protein